MALPNLLLQGLQAAAVSGIKKLTQPKTTPSQPGSIVKKAAETLRGLPGKIEQAAKTKLPDFQTSKIIEEPVSITSVQGKVKKMQSLTPKEVEIIRLNPTSFPNVKIETPVDTARKKLEMLNFNFTEPEKKAIEKEKLKSPVKMPGVFRTEFEGNNKGKSDYTFPLASLLEIRKKYPVLLKEAQAALDSARANGVDPGTSLTAPQAQERIDILKGMKTEADKQYASLTNVQKYAAELASISQDVQDNPLLNKVPILGGAAKDILSSGSRALSNLISPKGFEAQTGEEGSRLKGLEEGLYYGYGFVPEVAAARTVNRTLSPAIASWQPDTGVGEFAQEAALGLVALPELLTTLRTDARFASTLGKGLKVVSPSLYEKGAALVRDIERSVFPNKAAYTPKQRQMAQAIKDFATGTANFTAAQQIMSKGQAPLKESLKSALMFEFGMKLGSQVFGRSVLANFPIQFATFAGVHAAEHPNATAGEIARAGAQGLVFALVPFAQNPGMIKQAAAEIAMVKDAAKVGLNQYAFGKQAAGDYIKSIEEALGRELNGFERQQLAMNVSETAKGLLTKLGAALQTSAGFAKIPGSGKEMTPEEALNLSPEQFNKLSPLEKMDVVKLRFEARQAEAGKTVKDKPLEAARRELQKVSAEYNRVQSDLEVALGRNDIVEQTVLETKLAELGAKKQELSSGLRSKSKVETATPEEVAPKPEDLKNPELELEAPIRKAQQKMEKNLSKNEPNLGKEIIEKKRRDEAALQEELAREEARIEKQYGSNKELKLEDPYVQADRILRENGIIAGEGMSKIKKASTLLSQGWGKGIDFLFTKPLSFLTPKAVKRVLLGNRAVTPEEYKQAAIAKDVMIQNAADDFMRIGEQLYAGTSQASRLALGKAIRGEIPMEQLAIEAKNIAGEIGEKGVKYIQQNLQKKAELARQVLDNNGALAVKYGLLDAATYEANKGSYMARMYEIYENPQIKQFFGLYPHPTKLQMKNFIARKDIDPEVRNLMGEMLEPAYAVAKGGFQVRRDIILADFFRRMAGMKEVVSEADRPGWIQLSNDKKWGAIRDKWVQPDVYKDLMDIAEFRNVSNKDVQGIVSGAKSFFTSKDTNAFKELVGIWKKAKVIYNPATHGRNVMSNMALLDLSGMPLTTQFAYLPFAIRQLAKGGYWAQAARAAGAIGNEYNPRDFQGLYDRFNKFKNEKTIPGTIKYLASQVDGKITGLYQNEEALFKLMKFMHEVKSNGATVQRAAAEAKKWLFDYSDVPHWVKFASSYYQPFITFKYKAVPRIVEAAWKKPWKFVKYALIFGMWEQLVRQNDLNETEEERQERLRDRPDYVRGTTFGADSNAFTKYSPAGLLNTVIGKGQKGTIAEGIPNFLTIPVTNNLGELNYLDLSFIWPWNVDEANNPDKSFMSNFAPQTPFLSTLFEIGRAKNFFNDQPLYNPDDPAPDKVRAVVDHVYKTIMPSWAPELLPDTTGIKGGYSYEKLKSALTGRPYRTPLGGAGRGRVLSTGQALLETMLGLKFTPVDPLGARVGNVVEMNEKIDQTQKDMKTTMRYYDSGQYSIDDVMKIGEMLNGRWINFQKGVKEDLDIDVAPNDIKKTFMDGIYTRIVQDMNSGSITRDRAQELIDELNSYRD